MKNIKEQLKQISESMKARQALQDKLNEHEKKVVVLQDEWDEVRFSSVRVFREGGCHSLKIHLDPTRTGAPLLIEAQHGNQKLITNNVTDHMQLPLADAEFLRDYLNEFLPKD